jgi:hypothetical protein
MARDNAEPKSGGRKYYYSKCATCHTKVNISAYSCPRCKNRITWDANRKEWEVQAVYGSRDPDDEIYGITLCSVERCMVCETALGGHPCRYVMCYGTNRADRCDCASCERYEARRYACCQEARKENEAIEAALFSRGAIQGE